MKKITSFLLALLLTSFACAQQAPSSDPHEVQQTVIKLFDALSARDAVALKNQCTTDVRFYEYGEAWPADTIIDLAITKNTAPDFKRVNTFDFVNTTIKGDVAWTTYTLHSEGTSNGKTFSVDWMETVVLVREEKRWKINVLHSTNLTKK
jgi:ketosteroid isomerase-like protein